MKSIEMVLAIFTGGMTGIILANSIIREERYPRYTISNIWNYFNRK